MTSLPNSPAIDRKIDRKADRRDEIMKDIPGHIIKHE